jgi:hypothetical protein
VRWDSGTRSEAGPTKPGDRAAVRLSIVGEASFEECTAHGRLDLSADRKAAGLSLVESVDLLGSFASAGSNQARASASWETQRQVIYAKTEEPVEGEVEMASQRGNEIVLT